MKQKNNLKFKELKMKERLMKKELSKKEKRYKSKEIIISRSKKLKKMLENIILNRNLKEKNMKIKSKLKNMKKKTD